MHTTTAPNLASTIGIAADRAHQAVDHASAKVTPAVDRATEVAHKTIDQAARAAAPAADWAVEHGRQVATTSTEMVDACSNYVRARPLMSIFGALAVGYFAGKLMR